MFLKRIVLNGFKSFADRTEFEFGEGITAVVGPNGCGKSNVLDAVRWGLGEQSARTLRGGKMQDIIFSGSRSRKPANFAEVELVFDNRGHILRHDAEEVAVARTLYRSGESEYRINGKGARLRDVRELLLDTGVGVDAYSVIAQGKVDLLLQSNPVERREIFEEAAGISRYKVRRVEAQRKLERTQNNLLRLQDIVEELEKRLRSVRLAAGKARNFQEYDRQLRELRSSYALAEFHELEQARAQLADTVATRAQELHSERAALVAEEAAVVRVESERDALTHRIEAEEADLRAAQNALSTLAERLAQIEKRLPELATLRERRQRQAEDAAARLAQQRERIATEQANFRQLEVVEEQASARVTALQGERAAAERRAGERRSEYEQEREAAFEAARRGALLQNEQVNATQQRARFEAQLERLGARARDIEQERGVLAGRLAELEERTARLDTEIDGVRRVLNSEEGELAALHAEAEQLDEEITSLKEGRSATLSRLKLLEDMERRLEGVDQGTRAVLGWRGHVDHNGTVAGLVADVLRIDGPRVGALQAVLATIENHIVVRETAAFLAALERHGGAPGPVRVVALDRLGREPARIAYDHAPGYIGRAADWVDCEALYRPLAERLLGRVFVVETPEDALRLAPEAPVGSIFVTLAGETVGADGRLSFGTSRGTLGLISRKAEIRQLQEELESLETRLVHQTRRRMELDAAVSDLQLRKSERLEQIARLQREHAESRGALGRVHEARERHEREARLLADEMGGVQRSAQELRQRLTELAAETATTAKAQQQHEARTAELLAAVQTLEGEVAGLQQQCTEALVARGRAGEKRSAAAEALAELEAQADNLVQAQGAARREADEAAWQISAAESERETTQAAHQKQEAECVVRSERVGALRSERETIRLALESQVTAVRGRYARVEELDAALGGERVQLRECEVRKEALTTRIREELEIDLAKQYEGYEHTEHDWAAIKAEIDDLRGKIARLGNVNLDALTELEELTPRYEQLVAQRDDLTYSIAQLEQLITDLDDESRTRFTTTFEEIRTHFEEMFRKLFGGGKADIILEDPTQPLECGIEIVARPPGKTSQTISLLSGGEKTMTAVALVMAVFRSRPSPFAILDEVDAALDEANTERFNGILQEFLSYSQFVIITHSKQTMASADVLYGVTMEEPGVSKRVSVRFEDRVRAPSVA
ncbi:MAG: chromosome segregation protein SMC [Phycisphaerales bacterium]|nr:chromosome segregation protein SMC [Phycisphaerales bacterium]